ncbi:MAG: hypothetical protein VYC93_09195 [Pseudomonadota bacterium]|nr:hypothetical protein [Pseudomonadota bacterium]
MRKKNFVAVAAVFGLIGGCSDPSDSKSEVKSRLTAEAAVIEPCAADESLSVWCGYKNPEDLALTPDGDFLLATGFGGLPDPILNEMSIIELSTMQHSPVEIVLAENVWGDPSCERTTLDLSSHGLDIKQRSDGTNMVAITNHLPKETVELFELLPTETSWQLIWRGCAESPVIESGARQPMFNDVALTADGKFYTTEMYNIMTPFEQVAAAGAEGKDTGAVWYWTADSGFAPVAGSSGSFPNGIVINDAEDTLYVNYWFSGVTIKLDIKSGEVLAKHQGGRADNLTLVEGSVWAAKHDMTFTEYAEGCPADSVNCFLPFSVYELDLNDLTEKNAWSFNSEIFGMGTVATPAGDAVWSGTAHGDRVARLKIKPSGAM